MKVLGTIVVFACSILIYAQVPATVGSITGIVQDESGNVIPGVTVTAVGLTGRVSAVSDPQGTYTLSSVPPGTYAVSAFLQGFAETRFIDIELRSGATIRLGFTLRVQPRLQFQMPVPPPRDNLRPPGLRTHPRAPPRPRLPPQLRHLLRLQQRRRLRPRRRPPAPSGVPGAGGGHRRRHRRARWRRAPQAQLERAQGCHLHVCRWHDSVHLLRQGCHAAPLLRLCGPRPCLSATIMRGFRAP